MKFRFLSIIVTIVISLTIQGQTHPKREFRGAWIPTVTSLYRGMSTDDMKQRLIDELDILQKAGINAILFQVRPEADALYDSLYEPWSRYLTGEQGKQPSPYWDPMTFMIEECHNRFMEFHAWINPYRVKANIRNELAPGHLYYEQPERFIEYDNKLFLTLPYRKTVTIYAKWLPIWLPGMTWMPYTWMIIFIRTLQPEKNIRMMKVTGVMEPCLPTRGIGGEIM